MTSMSNTASAVLPVRDAARVQPLARSARPTSQHSTQQQQQQQQQQQHMNTAMQLTACRRGAR
eukprot:10444403-Alexandrium_andersonii.AAC.1